ncbi:transposase [Kineosporia babensis]|uniref:Transposase n=1 Tax=Kineosporia babensis TaxID=499548 RepID=A0A9X1NN94_9ACTN|nr:transposase [Kineosporia babensis]
MTVEARRDPQTAAGAIQRIAGQLGIHPEALRSWVKKAEVDAGQRAGTTSTDAARIAELERENRELKRANAILKSASAFFAAELCATRRRVDRGAVRDRSRRVVAAA